MKIIILLILVFIFKISFAQNNIDLIIGHWVKTKIEYKSGEQLPDDKEIKHSYTRYSLDKSSKIFISSDYNDLGLKMFFKLKHQQLDILSEAGFVTNSFQIEKIDAKNLVLLQEGQNGFKGEDCLRLTFIKENIYQNALSLTNEDIIAIYQSKDTLFRASEKIHAKFKGDISFHEYLTANIREYDNVVASNNYFLASFIVRKTGEIDSIQILENINKNFDSQFLKALKRIKKSWIPASRNGHNVDVLMTEHFEFDLGNRFLSHYDYMQKGKQAMEAKEYINAIYYFSKSLEKVPDNVDVLYQRAICYLYLGNKPLACEDLQRIKTTGSLIVNQLIEQNCK
jgi:tetratricopeptide (TPR) repeat protein